MKLRVLSVLSVAALFVVAPAGAGDCGGSHGKAAKATIVDTAVAAGSFETLVAAVKAAGLVETLQSEGPFTVFAPTDEAFAKLPPGTIEGLLANPERLKQVLLYHVVPGRVSSSQVASLDRAATAQGSDLQIMVADGQVMINDAKVVQADIETSNGIIHVIDTVIVPSA